MDRRGCKINDKTDIESFEEGENLLLVQVLNLNEHLSELVVAVGIHQRDEDVAVRQVNGFFRVVVAQRDLLLLVGPTSEGCETEYRHQYYFLHSLFSFFSLPRYNVISLFRYNALFQMLSEILFFGSAPSAGDAGAGFGAGSSGIS